MNILVSDIICPNSGHDVSDSIQQIIDQNPNCTVCFPDGEYLISKPICTPADPKKSVSLQLSPYTVIKASTAWNSADAMIRLGSIHPANDIRTNGSNYSLSGGILDGSNVAGGVSINGGRETVIRDVSIKHVTIGIHIRYGANSGSSDADIYGVNIIGNGRPDSIGVLLEGFDNTLTNMRIADVHTGVLLKSSGNSMRNLHPLYTCDYTDYQNSCGFDDRAGNNWYNFCYSDHFGIGFRNAPQAVSIYDSCFTMWYCNAGERHTAIRSDGAFRSIFTNFRIGFFDDKTENIVLSAEQTGGNGVIERLSANEALLTDTIYKAYLEGRMF